MAFKYVLWQPVYELFFIHKDFQVLGKGQKVVEHLHYMIKRLAFNVFLKVKIISKYVY